MRYTIFVVLCLVLLSGCQKGQDEMFDTLKQRLAEILGWASPDEPPKPESALPIKPGFKPDPDLPFSARFQEVRNRILPKLRAELAEKDLVPGDPVFIRIFKQESELELWMQPQAASHYQLFKTFPICNFSGDLGPKQKEGDRQSPEGFYQVSGKALNPNSSFHLSFNLGYPNTLERNLGRTGSFLMIHGDCQSIGCYAMTDAGIEPIYTLLYEALSKSQESVAVHAFPFRFTEAELALWRDTPWYDFWQNLKLGFDAFEESKTPPKISFGNKIYEVTKQP